MLAIIIVIGVVSLLSLVSVLALLAHQKKQAAVRTEPINKEDLAREITEAVRQEIKDGSEALSDKVSLAAANKSKGMVDDSLKSHQEISKEVSLGIEKKVGGLNEEVNKLTGMLDVRHGELNNQLGSLSVTTSELNKALVGASKGQLGEDLIKLLLDNSGFIEGIHYFSQKANAASQKPDYVFPVPPDRIIVLDSKLNLEDYKRWVIAKEDGVKTKKELDSMFEKFVTAVRKSLKELSKKSYEQEMIDGNMPLDFVLMCIPNNNAFDALIQHNQSILVEAQNEKIVLCSPITLLSAISVAREMVNHIKVLNQKEAFLHAYKELAKEIDENFMPAIEKVGDTIDKASDAYNELAKTRLRDLHRKGDKLLGFNKNDEEELEHLSKLQESHTEI